jgi:hypothetical protein
MLKPSALGPVLGFAALGAIFVGLDMLDVVEVYELPLPVPVLNAAFISGSAFAVAFITIRGRAATGSLHALWLSGSVLAFGIGSLLYGWLPKDALNARITVHEGSALFASVLHLAGVILTTAAPRPPNPGAQRRFWAGPLFYLGIVAAIAVLALLALQDMIPPFHVPESTSPLRDAVRRTTTVFFLASSLISLRTYSRLQAAFHLWYSVGLALFAMGWLLISLSAVEGLIAWLGRLAQYVGGIYFIVAALSPSPSPTTGKKELYPPG